MMTSVLERTASKDSPTRPWWRQRWLTILVGFALSMLAGMAFASVLQAQGDWTHGLAWERALLRRMHVVLPGPIDALMLVMPWFGTNISLIPGIALIVWWLWAQERRPHLAVRLAVVQLGSYLLNPALKGLYDRARPDLFPRRGWYGWTAYPSGHAIASVSVLLTLAIVLWRARNWRWPFYVVIPVMITALYSRLYLGVHWPTDVLGGAIVGATWLIATSFAFRDGDINGRPPSS